MLDMAPVASRRGSGPIDYELPSSGVVQLEVFTAAGARVRVLLEGREVAGRRRLYWDGCDDRGRSVPSGVYWVRLQAASDQRSRKLEKAPEVRQ